ncbi:Probable carboxylesterase 2 [Striga hermonthica]|uniref:Probable carboxylesterase 2 n=1 Tax=Striga hermonthica TaxID=68872 RepID=A0A9N7N1A4_STRHE|nr:Probable carboxylesterase 2 [Striga hermonthica]
MADECNQELDYEFLPFIKVYKNGHVKRLMGTKTTPPGNDPQTCVTSKDVTDIIPETEVYARIYLPTLDTTNTRHKRPLVVYFHGGGFLVNTPSSTIYHNHLNDLAAECRVIVVSVNYRKAPEHPLPIAYEDSWAVFQWVASHCNGDGPEDLLNQHADFGRIFVAGDSAGGNIAHNLAMAAGNPDAGLKVAIHGMVLIDPYFWGSDTIGSEGMEPGMKAYMDRLWPLVCPSCPADDPWINPMAEGGLGLAGLGCRRVLVSVAEKDILKDRGWHYFQVLSRSGWMGMIEIHEAQGERHVFHLNDSNCDNSKERMKRMADFFNSSFP